MERRLLLAILLTFLVLTVYQWLLPKPPPGQTPGASPTGATSSGTSGSGATGSPPSGSITSTAGQSALTGPAAPIAAELPPVQTVVADTTEKTIVVDNGSVRAEFSNRGANITSWQLLQYHDNAGKPLELVPRDAPPDSPRPFSLKLDDPAKTARVNTALYNTVNSPPATVDGTRSPAALTFEYQDASGLHVRKQFRIEPNSYVITFSATVMDGDAAVNPSIRWGPGLGDILALGPGNGRNIRRAEGIYDIDGSVKRQLAPALKTTPRYEGNFAFAGVDTHYFISVAIKPGPAQIEYEPVSVPIAGSNPPLSRDYIAYDIRLSAPPSNARFFFGPKHFDTLKAVDGELVRAIWFGMFSFLAVPLLSALNWIHRFVGNYGWSILALTVLINAVMFPLRHKSFVSMRKMQEIQPQVKQIQDRYAKLKMSDPARQKMNTELMDLYRSKGVNPASGCIPMLLTFPVLLAFYGLLSESVELRGAPFIFWIKDLSVMDPYYVTPILMGVSQLAQQRMAPAAADPAQQKMMMIMPVVFTFLFITYPSGLALYWLASNVLLIGQQMLTNYLIGPPDIRVPRPSAERRLKKVGEGKTEAVAEGEPG
ncbi:MAG TPA: membrane protein insertase YidC [Vicinamibacterales bacterium]|jgi:YidC/Oxa1 family membrane protein insertase|nr:membrane protein insertase YidC [Vicinamibacterales bacterium]